jgi:hypothetical protein
VPLVHGGPRNATMSATPRPPAGTPARTPPRDRGAKNHDVLLFKHRLRYCILLILKSWQS